jgi:hypothetical protein
VREEAEGRSVDVGRELPEVVGDDGAREVGRVRIHRRLDVRLTDEAIGKDWPRGGRGALRLVRAAPAQRDARGEEDGGGDGAHLP